MRGRNVISEGIAALVFAGCGGGAVATLPTALPDKTPHGVEILAIFHYTGGPQKFIVPRNLMKLTFTVRGASGGGATAAHGLGGVVRATIPVTPGQTLRIFVGGKGAYYSGGYNGGGVAI